MSAILCWFSKCRLVYIADALKPTTPSKQDPLGMRPSFCGIYQCSRCKAVSIGSPKAE
jgi:hypothetical protein